MGIFHLRFKKFQKNFFETFLTFSIGNIKSREPSVGQILLHGYDVHGDEVLISNNPVFEGDRFVITEKYHSRVEEISLSSETLSQIYELEFELVLYGLTSENPCYFNQLMLETGEHTEYHKPNESLTESRILFKNNNYAVLYSDETHSLQVIRPLAHDDITTKKLLKSKYTVLAPHLDGEPVVDAPANLMMEFINQTEQKITIDK